MLAVAVAVNQTPDYLLGDQALGQQVQTTGTETQVGPGLRGDGADPCPRPRHDRADRQELAGNAHTHLASRQIYRDDGERRKSGLGDIFALIHVTISSGSVFGYFVNTSRPLSVTMIVSE